MPPDEATIASSLFIAFAGRYEATETHVTHHIELCLRHERAGLAVVRAYAFAGSRLIISDRGLSLVWERIVSRA